MLKLRKAWEGHGHIKYMYIMPKIICWISVGALFIKLSGLLMSVLIPGYSTLNFRGLESQLRLANDRY